MFRNYESFGYITDNRNFGYQSINSNEDFIGDKIVSRTGAFFLSVLCQEPQSLNTIVQKLMSHFRDVDIETLLSDSKEFYTALEEDGFILSGRSANECAQKDLKFSYRFSRPIAANNESHIKNSDIRKETQEFFNEYFNSEPQLKNLHIEITSKCNERCCHCYLPHDNKVSHMDSDLFYRILDQCEKMKLLHVTLTGGEPMLHPNIISFLKKCKEYNLSVNVLSNLTLLSDDLIEEMKSNRLLCVQVSLYSMDHKIHDSITQVNGSFENTLKSIKKLIKNNIPLQISCPIMKQNRNSYKDVLTWANKHNIHVGCDYVIIGKCDYSMKNLSCRLAINDVRDIIWDKISNEPKYFEQLIKEAEQKNNYTPDDTVCSICHSSMCISETGRVYPCAGWNGCVVGDVTTQTLKDVWTDSKEIKHLRNLRLTNFPECIQCSYRQFCTLCMARNANENTSGDSLCVNEFYCAIAKCTKESVMKFIETQNSEVYAGFRIE